MGLRVRKTANYSNYSNATDKEISQVCGHGVRNGSCSFTFWLFLLRCSLARALRSLELDLSVVRCFLPISVGKAAGLCEEDKAQAQASALQQLARARVMQEVGRKREREALALYCKAGGSVCSEAYRKAARVSGES